MSNEHFQLKGMKPASPHTNRRGGYQKGQHLEVCDRSGKIYDSAHMRKEWNGLKVGKDEWEPRHPQEFRRGIKEDIAVREARPGATTLIDLATDIDDITAVSGSVVSSVYTSGAATNARPFVYWTVDLGASYDLALVTLAGLALSGTLPPPIRQGLFLDSSADDVTYTSLSPSVGNFNGGVNGGATTYTITSDVTARYLRLALYGGKGLGYTGLLTQTGLTVTRKAY